MDITKVWIKKDKTWILEFPSPNVLSYPHSPLTNPIQNLLQLENINSPEILYHLKKRYIENLIYTYAGKILISINPFQPTSLYSSPIQSLFLSNLHNNILSFSNPHLYELANDSILSHLKNFSFLISGESGSGKTESTKKLLDYFSLHYKDTKNILPTILEFNSILEAFGNASTSRNHNSSRFGKFITININQSQEISAKIRTYLLEKIRVVSDNLSNYHIFYSFGYQKNTPNYLDNPREDWDHEYLLEESLEYIWNKNNLDKEYWEDIKKTILFLIQLLQNSLSTLQSHLPFISSQDINNLLSFKTIKATDEIIQTPLSPNESLNMKNTLIMTLYEKLFDRIVEIFNSKLTNITESKKTFSILDIFGFEVFKNNYFEQLCINYTNEKLQSIFNKYVFEEEIKLFEYENISISRVNFENNTHILDFFDKKPDGFFPLLDEKSILGASDKDFSLTLPKNEKVIKIHLNTFTIKHYADNVTYEFGDFSVKNMEKSNTDIQEFLLKIYKNMKIFTPYATQIGRVKRGSIGMTTITSQFRQNLNLLMNELSQSELYFIRCIKPNDDNIPNCWIEDKIENQLNYCGITSALELARQTFPVRMTIKHFLNKYEILQYDVKELDKNNEILLGKTMVFFTNEKQNEFNKHLIESQKKLILQLAANIQQSFYRKKYIREILSIEKIKRCVRGYWARLEVKERRGVRLLLNNIRNMLAKKELLRRKSLGCLQSKVRRIILQKEYQLLLEHIRRKESKIIIEKIMRRYFIRQNYTTLVVEERNKFENIMNLKIHKIKNELEYYYQKEIDKLGEEILKKDEIIGELEVKNEGLEKYEKLYNDLYKIVDSNQVSVMFNIFEEDIVNNLRERVNFEKERYQIVCKRFDEIQKEYQDFRAEVRETQILVGEKMHMLFNENLMLKEENMRLTDVINKTMVQRWYERIFFR